MSHRAFQVRQFCASRDLYKAAKDATVGQAAGLTDIHTMAHRTTCTPAQLGQLGRSGTQPYCRRIRLRGPNCVAGVLKGRSHTSINLSVRPSVRLSVRPSVRPSVKGQGQMFDAEWSIFGLGLLSAAKAP